MKTARLPHLFHTALCSLALLTTPVALAAPIASSLVVDELIGKKLLENSGDETERTALRALSGIESLILASKVEFKDKDTRDFDTSITSIWMISDTTGPGYFALKFGTGKTYASADTFFFKNIGDLTQLVWSNEQVDFLSGGACSAKPENCNIGRLSHYVVTQPVATKPPSSTPTTTPTTTTPTTTTPTAPATTTNPVPPSSPFTPGIPKFPDIPVKIEGPSGGQGQSSGGGAQELNDVPEPASLALLALGAMAAAGTRRRLR